MSTKSSGGLFCCGRPGEEGLQGKGAGDEGTRRRIPWKGEALGTRGGRGPETPTQRRPPSRPRQVFVFLASHSSGRREQHREAAADECNYCGIFDVVTPEGAEVDVEWKR